MPAKNPRTAAAPQGRLTTLPSRHLGRNPKPQPHVALRFYARAHCNAGKNPRTAAAPQGRLTTLPSRHLGRNAAIAIDANTRRAAAIAAIDAVRSGQTADAAETEIDFKEERGTYDSASGSRVPISSQHEPAARAIAEEVSCLVNSDSGGVLVVGVANGQAGPSAFVGTYLD